MRSTERRKRLGAGLPADFVQALNDEKQRLFSTALKAIDGVIALVESIAIPKAVASSATSAELIDKLRFTGLHHLFEPHIYSTELVEAGQPAPDIYFFAAGKLRCVPAQCLVIEDSVNGVRAGVAAGMTVWGFIGGGHADSSLGERLRAAGASSIFDDHRGIGRRLGLGTVDRHYITRDSVIGSTTKSGRH